MSSANVAPTPWREYHLEGGETQSVVIGPLRIDLRRENGEIWIAWSRSVDGESADAPSEWVRWAAPGVEGSVTLRPTLPDRALVVAPEVSFNLAPHSEARIYVRVPLVAQIVLGDRAQTVLREVPTIVMSNTWWGDFVGGELCYWLPTTARRTLEPEHFLSHLVACPVNIENRSESVLEAEKSAVRVAYLSIFGEEGRLWADETRVVYSGDEEGSEIDMLGEAPAEAPGAVLIAPPRQRGGRGFRARTFARLKSLSGF